MEYVPLSPEGLNVVPDTPVPLQVPPAVPVTKELRLTAAAFEHIGAGAVQVDVYGFVTVIDWQ
jgi:hypothetical protein